MYYLLQNLNVQKEKVEFDEVSNHIHLVPSLLCVCVCVCVCACMRARACMCTCVHACVRVHECVRERERKKSVTSRVERSAVIACNFADYSQISAVDFRR